MGRALRSHVLWLTVGYLGILALIAKANKLTNGGGDISMHKMPKAKAKSKAAPAP